MKITHIQTSNFLGARAVDVTLTKPVVMFAGTNGAGKSSLQEAIRMALTGEPVRVDLKKEYGAMITDNGESAFVEIGTPESAYSVVLPSGKGSNCGNPMLPYVLDAQRFAKMDENTRRTFLFGLMGVKMDGTAVKQRLLDKGCDDKKVEVVLPILRAGFDAASKEAAAKARDAKAGWKTATGGETWGKDKAPKWQPAPLPDGADRAAAKLENITKQRGEVDAELSKAQQELGAAKAEQRRQNEAEAKRLELHEQADKVERFQKKLALDTAELTAWEEKVAATRAKAGAKPNPKAPGEFLLRGLAGVTNDFLELSCRYPDVEWDSGLLNRASAHLAEYRKLHGEPVSDAAVPDPEAAAKLPEYENALALMQSAVANSKRSLETAQRAAEQLKELDGLKANADTSAAEAKVAELTEKRNAWNADLEKYRDIADKFSRRQALIDQVAKLHADVLAWSDIADALSPDGIPAELLAEALGPMNERLQVSASFAEWEPAAIHADMRITYGARDYNLISESEKWRTDAMIAEAVSFLAGVKLLVLDRFDVLDMKGREDLLYWLDGMAADGEIDTAIIFGTLKGLPALNLDSVEAFWIDNGTSGHLKEAA